MHALLRKKFAVVLVRARGRSVATIGWDLTTDTFRLGQWFRGRIYERRCDLSPDGKYLIYFAAKHGRRSAVGKRVDALLKERFKTDDLWGVPWNLWIKAREAIEAEHKKEFDALRNSLEAKEETWTAISRAPYLKAIDLWWKGDCWNGGGLFLSNRKVWLNHRPFEFREPVLESGKFEVTNAELPELRFISGRGECSSIYFSRLESCGWKLKSADNLSSHYDVLFEKKLSGDRVLQKRFLSDVANNIPGRGVYFEEHRITDLEDTQIVDGKTWEWADFDTPRERVIFARDGCLWALPLGKLEGTPVLLKDFNGMEFEAVPAPY